jgi:hypothetical protein
VTETILLFRSDPVQIRRSPFHWNPRIGPVASTNETTRIDRAVTCPTHEFSSFLKQKKTQRNLIFPFFLKKNSNSNSGPDDRNKVSERADVHTGKRLLPGRPGVTGVKRIV